MEYEVIDLTYLIEEGMPTFGAPWHPKVSIKPMGMIKDVGRNTKVVQLGTHTGTHIDAPGHFIEQGSTIDGISLSDLIGPVSLIDLRGIEPGHPVRVEDIKLHKLEKRVLFCFGWDKMWTSGKYYERYPFLEQETAEYLVKKGVKVLGLDTPSPDDSRIGTASENDSMIHKYLLQNNVILLEYLCHIDRALGSRDDLTTGKPQLNETSQLDKGKWQLVALPLKIKGADGSPARVCLFRETENDREE